MARNIELLRQDLGDQVKEGYVVHLGEQVLPMAPDNYALPFNCL